MHAKMRTKVHSSQPYVQDHRSPKLSRRANAAKEVYTLKDWLSPPAGFTAAVGDAIAWLAAATAARVVVDFLLSISPTFWIPGVAILVAPALFAIGLSTLMPQLSLFLGYRLLLVMFGLLIGGRL